ncbi:MAG: hypothetical protein NTZ97_00745 [Candidatus Moranbacteria bacterium]|nr:hypothetical protein [Candidatus Moranbacteria bacterium]
MGFKSFLGDVVKEFIPELVTEFLGVKSLKNFMLRKGRPEIKNEGAGTEEAPKGPEVKFGGIFDLSDETAYANAVGKLERDSDGKECIKKISSYLNTKETWQRRKFRAVVGILFNMSYTKEFSVEKANPEAHKKGQPKVLKKTKPVEINPGVDFLRALGKCISNTEMDEICKAMGILDSSLDSFKQVYEKYSKWIQTNETITVGKINSIRSKLPQRAKPTESTEPYRGWWKELTGIRTKGDHTCLTL